MNEEQQQYEFEQNCEGEAMNAQAISEQEEEMQKNLVKFTPEQDDHHIIINDNGEDIVI